MTILVRLELEKYNAIWLFKILMSLRFDKLYLAYLNITFNIKSEACCIYFIEDKIDSKLSYKTFL